MLADIRKLSSDEFGGREPKWEFAAGALFGVSDATSDITFKFDAEVEF